MNFFYFSLIYTVYVNTLILFYYLYYIDVLCNISNPSMRTVLDFKYEQFDQVRSKCEKLKSSPVRIVGFEMTSHTNKSLLKPVFH